MVNSREYLEKMKEDCRNHKNSISPICSEETTCETPVVKRVGVVVGLNEKCDFREHNNLEVNGVVGLVRKGMNVLVDDVFRLILLGE